MVLSERQQRHGAYWGAAAFIAGAAITWWVISSGENSAHGRLHRALWLYLSAHYISVGPLNVATIISAAPRLGLVHTGSREPIWIAIPVLTTALGAAGINIQLGRTHNHELILKNSLALLVGYAPAALIGLIWSNAAPGFGLILVIVGGIFLALTVGSSALGGVTQRTPVFAVTSLWGLFGLGILVLLGGWLLIRLLVPVAMVALVGALAGSAITYAARNY